MTITTRVRGSRRRRFGRARVTAAATAVAMGGVVLLGGVGSGASAAPDTNNTAETADRRAALRAVDVAGPAGIATAVTRTWSAAPSDFDRDGDQDVLIGYHSLEKLWRNEGDGTYVRVAETSWPAGPIDRHNCVWADVDRNGLPDVFCATGRGLGNRVKTAGFDNELWLQSEAGVFTDVGTEWGLGDPCGRGRDATFIDANGDVYPDLFVGNHVPRAVEDPCDEGTLPNERSKLYINQGGARFRHAPLMWPYGAGAGTRCAEVLDFDGDGWDDLFACRADGESPRLYRNQRGNGFLDVTARHSLRTRINDAVVRNLRADRAPEIVTAGPGGFAYHHNRDGRFAPATRIFTPGRGQGMAVAVGDADGDSDLDVYGMVGDGARGNPDDRILVNNRLSFAPVRVPSASGAADDVVVLRRTPGRKVDFLALNGYNLVGVGPVQLIRLVPAP